MPALELFAYLCVTDAGRAVSFYREVFGAEQTLQLVEPGGRIGHVELAIGGTTLMLCEPYPEYGIAPPDPNAPSSATLHVHVDDADATIERAIAQGATLLMAAKDMFYGERSGAIRDPFGHRWNIGHSIEEVSAEEMQRRFDQLAAVSDRP